MCTKVYKGVFMGLPFKHKIYFIYHVVGTWAVVV